MKQLVQSYKSGEVSFIDVPVGRPGAFEVQIETKASLISAGTERMLISFGRSSLLQKAKSQPDKVRQVIGKVKTEGLLDTYDAVTAKLDQPVPLGYSNVGIIMAVGSQVNEYSVGDRVLSNGRHAEVVNVGVNLVEAIPVGISDELASYAVVGSIGLQGIRLLKPEFGETVLVYGAGLIGLLAIQILIHNGCRVIAADIDQENLKVAELYGAEVIHATDGNNFEAQISALVSSAVIDCALVTAAANNDSIIKNCCSVLRKRGRIVLTGVVDLYFDRAWLYEKEISFQVSCSYGPGRYENSYEGRGLDYPIAFVRWTEGRNISAVLNAMSNGWVDVKHISKASFDFLDAAEAYDLLTNKGGGRPPMGIGLEYRCQPEKVATVAINPEQVAISKQQSAISVVGAGNYASRRMLPALFAHGSVIKHIVSKSGLSSSIAAMKFNAFYSSVDISDIKSAQDVGGVCVATRHDSHTDIAIQMVNAGKFVFVEKPLAINADQLARLRALDDEEKSHIFVGFNREFSEYVNIIKSHFLSDKSQKVITLEMNAGKMPADHWTQDVKVGGGRLIGEAIHYISLAQYLCGSRVKSLSVQSIGSDIQVSDTFSLTLIFENGDLANILYYATGSPKFRKESIKCIGGGKIFEIDNFKRLRGFGPGISINKRSLRQLKGQDECFTNFAKNVETRTTNTLDEVERYFEATEVSIIATDILLNQGGGSAEIR